MKYGVFGLGLTGSSAIKYLLKEGHEVICYADKALSAPHPKAKLINLSDKSWHNCDYILISPGVPLQHKIFKLADEYNIKLTSDIELFCQNIRRVQPNSKIIGVTGTNGKTTVVSLLEHGLQGSYNIVAAGNIGKPVLELDLQYDIYILELSSFQLNLLSEECRFDIGVLLNLQPDHLDFHGTIDHYAASKYKLLSNSDRQILGPITSGVAKPSLTPDIIFDGERMLGSSITDLELPVEFSAPFLMGKHNKANIIACYAVCHLLEVDLNGFSNNIESFKGLPHRMQLICQKGLVSFYNDSKATNCASSLAAINTLDNIYWLAGGVFKEKNLDDLKKAAIGRVKKGYFYGQSAAIFVRNFKDIIDCYIFDELASAMKEAYKDALDNAEDEQNILLSPACASYDQYKNFSKRGEEFTLIARELILLDTS